MALAASVVLGGCALERPASLDCAAPVPDVARDLGATARRSDVAETIPTGRPLSEAETADSMVPSIRDLAGPASQAGPATIRVLSLSAGGQFGAFGAGFLRGWAENDAAPRPRFDLVTGVSAGAMLAPVVFAGPEFDGALDVYDGLAQASVYRRRPILAWPRAASIADPAPLEALLRAQLSDALIAAVAARHDDGARLLVSAVNLDTTRQAVFDLGAIATSDRPLEARRDCMAAAMLASAAIPGLFPPRAIDGALHVDGGLRDQVFLTAIEGARARVARETGRPLRVEAALVVNGSLRPPAGPVADRLPAYIERSVVTLSDEVLRDSISETIAFALARPEWRIRGIVADTDLSACGDETPSGTFDPCVTAALYRSGRMAGRAEPIEWIDAATLGELAGAL